MGRSISARRSTKILKDSRLVKSRTMAGFDSHVPGCDCHGLPIELKVDRELGPKKRDMSVADFRRACRAYASRFIGVMTQNSSGSGSSATGEPVPDDGVQLLEALDRRALGKFVEPRLALRAQARPLVHPLPRGARRSGSRACEHSSPSIYVESRSRRRVDEIGQRIPR
jgi:isoleucyl-tRNA synthetase